MDINVQKGNRLIVFGGNYRIAVLVRSDFFYISTFPEVYHGGEISKAAFSGVQHSVIRDMIKHNIWCISSTGKRR